MSKRKVLGNFFHIVSSCGHHYILTNNILNSKHYFLNKEDTCRFEGNCTVFIIVPVDADGCLFLR
jgi:hypothetical protein